MTYSQARKHHCLKLRCESNRGMQHRDNEQRANRHRDTRAEAEIKYQVEGKASGNACQQVEYRESDE